MDRKIFIAMAGRAKLRSSGERREGRRTGDKHEQVAWFRASTAGWRTSNLSNHPFGRCPPLRAKHERGAAKTAGSCLAIGHRPLRGITSPTIAAKVRFGSTSAD